MPEIFLLLLSVTPHKDASPASHGQNTPSIIGDTFHVRRWPFCLNSNQMSTIVLSFWMMALLINLLDDPYDHDRCGIQFDCNERYRTLFQSDYRLPATPQPCPTTPSSLEILWP
jgi:hypothetical protein